MSFTELQGAVSEVQMSFWETINSAPGWVFVVPGIIAVVLALVMEYCMETSDRKRGVEVQIGTFKRAAINSVPFTISYAVLIPFSLCIFQATYSEIDSNPNPLGVLETGVSDSLHSTYNIKDFELRSGVDPAGYLSDASEMSSSAEIMVQLDSGGSYTYDLVEIDDALRLAIHSEEDPHAPDPSTFEK